MKGHNIISKYSIKVDVEIKHVDFFENFVKMSLFLCNDKQNKFNLQGTKFVFLAESRIEFWPVTKIEATPPLVKTTVIHFMTLTV